MTPISPATFKQSTANALFQRVPVTTTEAARKFSSDKPQSERMLALPILKGSPIDIRA